MSKCKFSSAIFLNFPIFQIHAMSFIDKKPFQARCQQCFKRHICPALLSHPSLPRFSAHLTSETSAPPPGKIERHSFSLRLLFPLSPPPTSQQHPPKKEWAANERRTRLAGNPLILIIPPPSLLGHLVTCKFCGLWATLNTQFKIGDHNTFLERPNIAYGVGYKTYLAYDPRN